MEHACVREQLDASIGEVWRLIRDFGDISAWAPKARVVQIEGDGVGAVRRVQSPAGLVVERCEAHDEQGRSFSYSLLESPWPFTDYLATVRLSPLGPDRCVIEWSSQYAPTASAGGSLREGIETQYRKGFIAALRKTLLDRLHR